MARLEQDAAPLKQQGKPKIIFRFVQVGADVKAGVLEKLGNQPRPASADRADCDRCRLSIVGLVQGLSRRNFWPTAWQPCRSSDDLARMERSEWSGSLL